MLRGIDHQGGKHLLHDPDKVPPVRGRYCVLIVVGWMLFLAVTIDVIHGVWNFGCTLFTNGGSSPSRAIE